MKSHQMSTKRCPQSSFLNSTKHGDGCRSYCFLKECSVEERISMHFKIYFFVLSNSGIKLNITNSFMFLKNHSLWSHTLPFQCDLKMMEERLTIIFYQVAFDHLLIAFSHTIILSMASHFSINEGKRKII